MALTTEQPSPSDSHALPQQAHAPGFWRPHLALGLEKMTEWALLTFQALQSLGLMFHSSHLQEQESKEKSFGAQEPEVAPKIIVKMLKIRIFISRKVDAIKQQTKRISF